eukprot:scaffold233491_cov22-Tisochrysis_lutea.AAC.1
MPIIVPTFQPLVLVARCVLRAPHFSALASLTNLVASSEINSTHKVELEAGRSNSNGVQQQSMGSPRFHPDV